MQVRPYLRHPLFPGLPDESLPLLGRNMPGEAESLQPLQPALGLYALDVVLPLFALHRPAGQKHAAGAEQRVEVSIRPPVHGRLRSLDGLIETDSVLRLDRLAHVVPGQPSEKERDQEHPVSRRSEAQMAQEPVEAGAQSEQVLSERAYERPPPPSNVQCAATKASATDNVAPTAPTNLSIRRMMPGQSTRDAPSRVMLPGVQVARKIIPLGHPHPLCQAPRRHFFTPSMPRKASDSSSRAAGSSPRSHSCRSVPALS